jgi:hypothetical protein
VRVLLETITFLILLNIYWLNNARRIYLKRRLGAGIVMNLKMTARNIALMLCPERSFKIYGDISSIKNGGILYSIHFGTWELMPNLLQKSLKKDIGILVNRYTENNPHLIGRLMDKFFYIWRTRKKVKVFYPDEVFKIVRFLKKGGIFAALVDGDTLYAKLKKIEKLSKLCHVPLHPFALYYDGANYIMEIGCNIDGVLKHRPFDYWWFYKSRRK